jgi:hypothetical protein
MFSKTKFYDSQRRLAHFFKRETVDGRRTGMVMEKPQKYFGDGVDNSTKPFIPKIKHKPFGRYPLGMNFFFFF